LGKESLTAESFPRSSIAPITKTATRKNKTIIQDGMMASKAPVMLY
jgi:hypothetical protein